MRLWGVSLDLSDPTNVRDAEREEKELRKRELNDIRTLLSNASGCRFAWRLLEHCKTFSSIYSKEVSQMAYHSGQQDLGHFLISEIIEADENLFLKLMKNNGKDKK